MAEPKSRSTVPIRLQCTTPAGIQTKRGRCVALIRKDSALETSACNSLCALSLPQQVDDIDVALNRMRSLSTDENFMSKQVPCNRKTRKGQHPHRIHVPSRLDLDWFQQGRRRRGRDRRPAGRQVFLFALLESRSLSARTGVMLPLLAVTTSAPRHGRGSRS